MCCAGCVGFEKQFFAVLRRAGEPGQAASPQPSLAKPGAGRGGSGRGLVGPGWGWLGDSRDSFRSSRTLDVACIFRFKCSKLMSFEAAGRAAQAAPGRAGPGEAS